MTLSLKDDNQYLRYFPYVIGVYFFLHFFVRIFISPNLEVDEAQFVGSTDFQLLYNNSHPPLYNWIIRVVLELTNWNWSIALPLIKNTLLFGMYILAFDLVYRITKNYLYAVTGVVSLLLLPQIVWQSQVTLAHSVLVAFACIALLHALTLVILNGRWRDYIWFGIVAAIGVLAKFHFLIFFISIAVILISHQEIRKFLSTKKVILSLFLLVLFVLPVFIAVIFNISQSTARMAKLYRESVFSFLDLPYVGVDGVFSFMGAFFAWCGPLLLFYLVMYKLGYVARESKNTSSDSVNTFIKVFGMSSLVAAMIFVLAVFVADMHFVHERYLTPLLLALPFWFVLRFPFLENIKVQRVLVRFSLFIMIGVLIGSAAMVMFNKHSLSYPYREFAAGLVKKYGEGLSILAIRERDYGNIVINIPDAKVVKPGSQAESVILVWRGAKNKVPKGLLSRLENVYKSSSEIFSQKADYYYFSGRIAEMHAQKFTRVESY